MRLHHGGHNGEAQKEKRVLNHTHLGGSSTGLSWMYDENAPVLGAFRYDPRQGRVALGWFPPLESVLDSPRWRR